MDCKTDSGILNISENMHIAQTLIPANVPDKYQLLYHSNCCGLLLLSLLCTVGVHDNDVGS